MLRNTKTGNMNIALWIAQALLSACFIWAGATKLFSQPEKLAAMWPWTAANKTLVKLTGVIDLVAGIGLAMPGLTGIYPVLTVYAAIGVIALMLAAIIFHVARGEAKQIGFNIIVIAIATFIAWGRWKG